MLTELKSDTARNNGAQSHGPITPEGKATSAPNSLRHGLTAKAVVLPDESQEDFEALRDAYIERFQPTDQVELDLVESMAASRWRLRRVTSIESGILADGLKIADRHEQEHRLAYAFKTNGESLAKLTRYENSLNRAFDRALKQLQLLQKSRLSPPVGSPMGSFRQPAGGAHPRPEFTRSGAVAPVPASESPLASPPAPDPSPGATSALVPALPPPSPFA